MDWQVIPDLPLQKIFLYLPKRERLYAALTCRRWYAAFYNPQLWRTFKFSWKPSQHKLLFDLETYRLYREFRCVGRFFRYIIVPATSDFYSLHGFLLQWRQCVVKHEAMGIPLQLHSFHLTFASEIIGSQVFGTGGRLLDTLKEVLARMAGLRNLVLDDLLLDVTDALTVLEEVIFICGLSLLRLSVVSICKEPAGFYTAALFPNLQLLRLSPIHLNAEVLDSLVSETRITRLVLRQNKFTMWPRPEQQMQYRPPAEEDWRSAVKRCPWLRVRFEVAGVHHGADGREGNALVMWPARFAPVDQVFFSYSDAGSDGLALGLEMMTILADYSETLTDFGYTRLPGEEESEEAAVCMEPVLEDALAWSELVSVCRDLQALYLPHRMPTWFLMVLTASLSHLRRLHVRRDMIFAERAPDALRSLWKSLPQETLEAAADAALSLSQSEREVAYLMQLPTWRFLTDAEFRQYDPVDESEMTHG